ncbi:MAG: choice-of-anchor D domain-containing protein [Gemmatimonadota bacterium]|nr:MAG: choice-of-anchor D domain-containing protein [Gemmatimonadota bacterium]
MQKSHITSHQICVVFIFIISFFNIRWVSAELRGETRFSVIDEAYDEGTIDYETALVQKVFSIFRPQNVDARFKAEGLGPEKCATSLFMEIGSQWSVLSPETQAQLLPYLLRPTEAGQDPSWGHAYTTDPEFYDTPSGHFRIWYVRTTDDAPDSIDVNPRDTVPDYVNDCGAIFDYVWTREVDALGYQAPPQDGDWYPQGEDFGDDSRYDVYIEDLGWQTVFGYTQGEYVTTGRSATSYIVVDNDYDWYPSYNQGKLSLDGLKVTAAHEFFHAIHFGYDAVEESDRYWMEISSVWMEDMMYDDVNDYFAYLRWFFDDPEASLDEFNGRHEYASCIWAIFLSKKYHVDIIREIWEGCVTTNALNAMQTALTERGSSLAEAFQGFSVWNYFTGSRSNPNLYYEEGADYPLLKFEERHLSYPASGSGLVNHLGANYIGFAPRKTIGGLRISFTGISNPNWKVMVIEYLNSETHFAREMTLDDLNRGVHATRNWKDYLEIALIPSVVSTSGQNYTYTYDAEYDPDLGASLEVSDAPHDFGSVLLGHTADWEMIVSNRGTGARTLYTVSAMPESIFTIQDVSLPQTLDVLGSIAIVVTFRPNEIGVITGSVTLTSDDPAAQEITIGLSGAGTIPSAVMQNFPSPFKISEHKKTYFPFNLYKDAEVILSIRSIAGDLVWEKNLGELKAGPYQNVVILEESESYWEGKNEHGKTVASGIYLYSIRTEDFVETKKIAVIR